MSPNDQTCRILDSTTVKLVGIKPAAEVTDLVSSSKFLHAGSQLMLHEVPGPMRGALAGALVFEGVARDLTEAEEALQAGAVSLGPCHSAGGVGAMAGVVTPTMPVVLVETPDGLRSFSPLNEGLGRALRFGSTDGQVLARLSWMRDVAMPILDQAIKDSPPIDLTELQAEGLRRGDECHNRNVATSATLALRLAPAVVRACHNREAGAEVLEYATTNPHFFLPFSMAAAKAIGDAASQVAGASVVTGICANGRRVSIRVGGNTAWFHGAAPLGDPRLFPGYNLEDALPAMGDSFATEVVGLGAFALTAAPAISSFIGGTAASALSMIQELRAICVTQSTRFLVPYTEFAGTPLGIDVARVVSSGITPIVNNGIAHRAPGRGQVGAGITRLPLEPFKAAAAALGIGGSGTSAGG